MTIKAKIYIFILVAVALTMCTMKILHSSKKNMANYFEKEEVTSSISKGIFEISLLTNDFLKHPLNRTLNQWNQKHNSLLKLLYKNKSLFQQELYYFKEIDQKLNGLKITFLKLSEEITSGRWKMHVQGYDSKLLLYEAKLATLSHDMIYNAETLGILIHSQLKTSQEKATQVVLLLFISFSALIIVFSWMIFSGILKPVNSLALSVDTIGEGNFDHKIKVLKQDEIGFLSYAFNKMSRRLSEITVHRSELEKEIVEREQAERTIIESEELFRAVFEQAGGYCMLLKPSDSGIPTILDLNEAACEVHGYRRDEMIGKPVADLDDEEGKRLCIERTQLIMSGKPLSIETNHVRKNGSTFPVAIYANIVQFENRQPLIVTTEFDITDRKKVERKLIESLKEKDILLEEIHHRVKNNLQVVSTLLKLQGEKIKGEKHAGLFNESCARVRSIALVHEMLYQSKNFTAVNLTQYFTTLANSLFRSQGVDPTRIVLNIDTTDINIGITTAIPCGLIVNELVSNALEHAFLYQEKGLVSLSLSTKDEDLLELVVSDNGTGLQEDIDLQNSNSLGLYLVKILAQDQLHGRIEIERTKGTKFTIIFKNPDT